MTSAANLILSVSILSMAVGLGACDSGGENAGAGGGPVTVGGGSSNAGTSSGGSSTSGGAGGGVAAEGVPLTPTNGWVDIMSNDLGIQGAVFAYSDKVSGMDLVGTFTDSLACMKGTAALVVDPCTIEPPATDCYGTFWGAAIGLNLNQPKDPVTGMGVKDALPYDASALKGFSFTITGNTVPAPKSLRFKVENAKGEFCTPAAKKVMTGPNTFLFKDLLAECWKVTDPPNATAETAQKDLLKISWAVVTDKIAAVPFDFCVSDIRALLKAGGSGTGGSGAGGSGAGGSAAGGSAAGGTSAGGTSAGGAGAGGASAGAGGASAGSGGASAGAGGASAGSSGAN
jgi:hypothetical protein